MSGECLRWHSPLLSLCSLRCRSLARARRDPRHRRLSRALSHLHYLGVLFILKGAKNYGWRGRPGQAGPRTLLTRRHTAHTHTGHRARSARSRLARLAARYGFTGRLSWSLVRVGPRCMKQPRMRAHPGAATPASRRAPTTTCTKIYTPHKPQRPLPACTKIARVGTCSFLPSSW